MCQGTRACTHGGSLDGWAVSELHVCLLLLEKLPGLEAVPGRLWRNPTSIFSSSCCGVELLKLRLRQVGSFLHVTFYLQIFPLKICNQSLDPRITDKK